MFFQSKLLRFLLPLSAYLLFIVIWLLNYRVAWYGNIPEETEYFRSPQMSSYSIVLRVLLVLFVLYLASGIVYLIKSPPPVFIKYFLAVILFLSSYCVWVYAVSFKAPWSNGIPLFLNAAIFIFSSSQITKSK